MHFGNLAAFDQNEIRIGIGIGIFDIVKVQHGRAFEDTATYRRDAAEHIYRTYPTRIYKGRLPPLIASVAVVDLHINSVGEVVKVEWVRAPRHLPQIMTDIEQLARGAAPYPAPVAMAGVIYTEVWLYDKTGLFQLATLTEGQRGK